MVKFDIDSVMSILEDESKNWNVPVVTLIAIQEKDPFKVLISTILSLRTKDEVTIEASKRIYKILKSPEDINKLSNKDIEKAIYPVGFYKRKTIVIRKICERLIEEFECKVPCDLDTLLTFDGVGRKTANLVLSEGFQVPAMCVDVHVHRISNRFGYIRTKDPEETEFRLREKLPQKHWIKYNSLLVALGQYICRPISPYCSKCPVNSYCKKVGVKKSR